MAIANTRTVAPKQQKSTGLVTYMANGAEIKLTTSIVKNYLVSGDPSKVSDQEVAMFVNLCKYNSLNPWLKEAYLIKYGSSPATMVTGIETYEKRAEANPQYDGYEHGIIVYNEESGEATEREGTFHLDSEKVVGGWCRVYRKDRSRPVYVSVAFKEVAQYKGGGELNSQWAKNPAWMVDKVAISRALKRAFPNTFAAMTSEDDVANTDTTFTPPAAQPDTIDAETGEVKEMPAEPQKQVQTVSNEPDGGIF